MRPVHLGVGHGVGAEHDEDRSRFEIVVLVLMLVLVTTVHECEVDEFTGSKNTITAQLARPRPPQSSLSLRTTVRTTVVRPKPSSNLIALVHDMLRRKGTSIRTDVWRMCDHTLTFALGSADRRALQNLSEATNLLVAL